MTQKIYIQVGVTALRTPSGGHYPAVPLYVEADRLKESGLSPAEENMLRGFAGFAIEEYGKRLREEREANDSADDSTESKQSA